MSLNRNGAPAAATESVGSRKVAGGCVERSLRECSCSVLYASKHRAEVRRFLRMATAQDKAIDDLREIYETIYLKVDSINSLMDRANKVFQCIDEAKRLDLMSQEAAINEKLSVTAKLEIARTEGPLGPEDLKKFLMEQAFGKPKPAILPIIQKYTPQVAELLKQLTRLKKNNNKAHNVYKEEQMRLDVNLNKRIDKLIKNARKVQKLKDDEKRSQTTLDKYVTRQ